MAISISCYPARPTPDEWFDTILDGTGLSVVDFTCTYNQNNSCTWQIDPFDDKYGIFVLQRDIIRTRIEALISQAIIKEQSGIGSVYSVGSWAMR